MKKVLVVARNEYMIAITSKAFLVGLFMMPIFMGGALVVQYMARDQVDLTPRRLAIIDETGRLGDVIQQRAEQRNADEIFEGEGDERKQMQAEFEIEVLASDSISTEEVGIQQSDRIRKREIFAFAIIEANVFDAGSGSAVRYHSHFVPSWRRWGSTWSSSRCRSQTTAR